MQADSITAMLPLQRNTAIVLNFANDKTPGGGYRNGSMAQEEDLCRSCPELQRALANGSSRGRVERLYPIQSKQALVTKSVTVLRCPPNMQLSPDLGKINVVSAAMPKMTERIIEKWPTALDRTTCLFVPRIKTILYACAQAGMVDLVLGPWGCGAFRCNRIEVVDSFIEVLKSSEFRGLFRNIIFAAIDPKTHDSPNWPVFTPYPSKLGAHHLFLPPLLVERRYPRGGP